MGDHRRVRVTSLDDTTVTASVNTATQQTEFMRGVAMQVTWTSTTASASVQMQVSNDGTNWSDVSGAVQAISNNSGTAMLQMDGLYSDYIRAEVTVSSGSVTTLKIITVVKGF